MSQSLHVLMATLEACDPGQINDPQAIETLLAHAVERADFTMLHLRVCTFEPQGVTGVAVVGESHLAIHTWPETGSLFFEVVSCAGKQKTTQSLDAIIEGLPGARVTQRQELTHAVPQEA